MTEAVQQDAVLEQTRERFGGRLLDVRTGADCATVVVGRDDLIELAIFLRDTPGLRFVRLIDVCGVDYLGLERTPRFATVYHLHSLELMKYLRIRVDLDEDDLVVTSVTGVWPGANYQERDVFDMFGIVFAGHPDLKRIFLPDEWVGYPLRKDYEQTPEPIEFSFNPEQWQKAVQRGD